MHAGFVVPDPDEEIIVAGELVPLYAGHDLQADLDAIEEYVDLNRYRGEYKDLTIVPKQTFIRNVLYYYLLQPAPWTGGAPGWAQSLL